ncbi:glucosaminidase domain-containing protein [Aliikangiella sp. IMCC44653]
MDKLSSQKDHTLVVSLVITAILVMVLINAHDWTSQSTPEPTKVNIDEPLPDFSQHRDVNQKKEAFFNYLRPIIRMENTKIKYDQALLEQIESELEGVKSHHAQAVKRKLDKLAKRYRVEKTKPAEILKVLKRRIDVIPESLVLAQAAKESGWGTSRFATEANNLFGQWCYQKGCGMVPSKRAANARHEVRVFQSPRDSVKSYMRNLNSHYAYSEFRRLRQNMRENAKRLSGKVLAQGLINYSERREDYVKEVVNLIEYNDLE